MIFHSLILPAYLLFCVQASPLGKRVDGPQVTIYPSTSDGQGITLTGITFPQFGQDVFLSIPYAEPPVGDLRFRPPEAKVFNASSYAATSQPPACLQLNNTLIGSFGVSEDCLYLNVFTPQGWGPNSPPLPVMVYVHGGAFQAGGISGYNATAILKRGIATNRPVIFVAIAYRLNILGFGSGSDIAANGAANLGLKDLQLGFQWVQENIWAFGGDPTQVTAFGQSAGATAITLLYLNQNTTLFRSAIMESGAQGTTPIGPTSTTWEATYDLFAQFSGCMAPASTSTHATIGSRDSAGSNTTTFDCIKALSAEAILNATALVVNVTAPSIDGEIITDSPHTLLAEGKFSKLPFITGNCVDEGTSFVPTSVTNETQVSMYIDSFEPVPPNTTILQDLLQVYPDDPSLGSPYGTGNETFGLAPEFKQIASIFGDALFQANRRWLLKQARDHGQPKIWSYLWTEPPIGISPPYQGVAHGCEVYYVYGFVRAETGYNAEQVALAQRVEDYW
ncbi:hypothetical protein M231_01731 [Tremella mesenterica]|uniref:Carboxylesterase type B domain-containing protein n=1 Tax=Tremella mesenterica TaxID=5217 RepID=A0A4Q1BS88_TREME|nr:hypothetical protein M231_01731 [Tremella mesenterica]